MSVPVFLLFWCTQTFTVSPRLRQKPRWCCCMAVFFFTLHGSHPAAEICCGSPAGQQALLEPPPDIRRQRSGSGDIKEQSVSAHIYRQTDLWWNFKEIIYISPPLNWCMKFSSTMKHTQKKVYLKSNKSARAAPKQLTLKYIFNTFPECVHVPKAFTSCANSFLTFEGGQFVRLVNRITFEGSAMANRNTIKWQSWIFL